MELGIVPSQLAGAIAVPGSKSHTIRGIVAALAASGRSLLKAPLVSEDTSAVLQAARDLGAQVEISGDQWWITGTAGQWRNPGHSLDLQNSGTGLRLLTAQAALQNFPVSFDGDSSLRSRPMAGILKALQNLQVQIDSADFKAPLQVQGPVQTGQSELDGLNSQYLTAMLLALPQAAGDFVLDLPFLNERPYVDITLDWLARLGIEVHHSSDYLHWEIPGGQKIHAFERTIPADFSTAAFPVVAGMLCGGRVEVQHLDFSDAQGDKMVMNFLAQMGAQLERHGELAVRGGVPLRGGTFDLNATPDALPIMAVAAAFASGETRLVNVPQARCKETDRIAAMALELRKMRVMVEELPDGLVIQGGRPVCGSLELDSRNDHRIAMALTVAALAAQGESRLACAEAAQVSYPDFFADFKKLGAQFK